MVNAVKVSFPVIPDFSALDQGESSAILCPAKQKAQVLLTNASELERIISIIDLTTLSGDDTRGRVRSLVDKAVKPIAKNNGVKCAAVCVYPLRVNDVVERLKECGEKLAVASVAAGFPSGQYHLKSRLLEIELAVADGATEIDVVINRGAALDGDWQTVTDELCAMKEKCGDLAHLKVILAVGELKSYDAVYRASWAAMLAGADFIKTSTGKETVNASLDYTFVMCTAICDYFAATARRVGFKAAGGIKTAAQALQFRALVEEILGADWLDARLFRIGASSLLDDVLSALEKCGR